jgi:pimeloyl-ACP methyl ester carboxylesterase
MTGDRVVRPQQRRTAVSRLVSLSVAVLLAQGSPCAAFQEEVRTLETRPGVTESFLLVKPDAVAVASVILFSGSDGVAAVERFQDPEWGRVNFLVRNRRRFVEHGFLVAVVDVPSDHTTGYGWFRTSNTHAQDVAGVIAALRREALVPVWVVGTSMGTISAANAAARLRVGGPDGLVLTSSVTRRSGITRRAITLRDVGLEEITVPTLVVHHQSDGCVTSPFAGANMLTRQLKRAPKKEFVAFQGGTPVGDPCEAFSAHGFMGIDNEVVKAIADWIKATR